MQAFNREEWRRLPKLLLLTLTLLVGLSLIAIASASHRPIAEGEWINDGYHLKQLNWLLASMLTGIAIICVPYLRIQKASWAFWVGGLVLLLGVAVAGRTVNGAKRWIDLKFMLLQPSELVKLAVIMTLAHYLRCCKTHRRFSGLIKPGLIVAIPMLLIVKQPDLGTSLVLPPIFFAMLYVAGAKKRHLGVLVGAGVMLAVVYTVFMMKPYQFDRLTAFLDPESAARTDGYHLIQSRTAIGAGGLTGNGYGHGVQNSLGYLPENHTDFVFAVLGEEWGLVGAGLAVLLYAVLVIQILMVAWEVREPFGRLYCVGVATLFGFQMFVNIGMTIGLMPITGLTLPFVSYGGSSLIASSIAIAMVINIRMRQVTFY